MRKQILFVLVCTACIAASTALVAGIKQEITNAKQNLEQAQKLVKLYQTKLPNPRDAQFWQGKVKFWQNKLAELNKRAGEEDLGYPTLTQTTSRNVTAAIGYKPGERFQWRAEDGLVHDRKDNSTKYPYQFERGGWRWNKERAAFINTKGNPHTIENYLKEIEKLDRQEEIRKTKAPASE